RLLLGGERLGWPERPRSSVAVGSTHAFYHRTGYFATSQSCNAICNLSELRKQRLAPHEVAAALGVAVDDSFEHLSLRGRDIKLERLVSRLKLKLDDWVLGIADRGPLQVVGLDSLAEVAYQPH